MKKSPTINAPKSIRRLRVHELKAVRGGDGGGPENQATAPTSGTTGCSGAGACACTCAC